MRGGTTGGTASWSHLAGLALFVGMSARGRFRFFWPPTGRRSARSGCRTSDCDLTTLGWTQLALHFLFYPIGVLICVLPWSPLLTAYGFGWFRNRITDARPMTVFLGLALLVAFPTCWLVPGAKERYFMPLFPCMAPLIGLVIQRALSADAPRALRIGWPLYLGGVSATILFGGLAVAGASWINGFQIAELTQPRWFAAVYLGLAVAVLAVFFGGERCGQSSAAICLPRLHRLRRIDARRHRYGKHGEGQRRSSPAIAARAQTSAARPAGQLRACRNSLRVSLRRADRAAIVAADGQRFGRWH